MGLSKGKKWLLTKASKLVYNSGRKGKVQMVHLTLFYFLIFLSIGKGLKMSMKSVLVTAAIAIAAVAVANRVPAIKQILG